MIILAKIRWFEFELSFFAYVYLTKHLASTFGYKVTLWYWNRTYSLSGRAYNRSERKVRRLC